MNQVEYETTGWLDKNKDPINDNVAALFARATNELLAKLYEDYDEDVRIRLLVERQGMQGAMKLNSFGPYVAMNRQRCCRCRRRATSAASRRSSSLSAHVTGYVYFTSLHNELCEFHLTRGFLSFFAFLRTDATGRAHRDAQEHVTALCALHHPERAEEAGRHRCRTRA